MTSNAVALILAAGASRRLGRSKPMLPWGPTNLLRHAIASVLEAGCKHCVVVLGSKADEAGRSLSDCEPAQVSLIQNNDWQLGQFTSLHCGIRYIQHAFPDAPVLVTLCDQPLISVDHYRSLIDLLSANLTVTATAYENGGGVPACFAASVLMDLVDLAKHPAMDQGSTKGSLSSFTKHVRDHGAKHWIRRQSPESLHLIDCPEAEHDIDTATAYAQSIKHQRDSN